MVQTGSALPPEPLCVDRGEERRRVQALWSAPTAESPRVAVYTGPRGIGKSTVLMRVAHDVKPLDDAEPLFETVLYHEIPEGSSRSIVTADDVAAHLLCPQYIDWRDLPGLEYRAALLRTMIAGQRVLIVLDNVSSPAQLWPLLGDLRNAAVIVGSSAGAEVWFDPRCRAVPLGGLTNDYGVELLRALAGPAVDDVDSAVLQRFVAMSGGHPELLAVVARRLSYGDESAEEYLQILGSASARELEEEISAGDTSIFLKVYETEYRSLAAAAAAAYRLLGILPISRFDVERVAAALDCPVREAKRLLRTLAERGLVRERHDGTCAMSHMAREHARAKAQEVDLAERERALRGTIRSCAELAVGLAKAVSGRPIVVPAAQAWFNPIEARYVGEGAAARATAEFAVYWPILTEAALAAARAGLAVEALALWLSLWPFGYQTVRCRELIDGYGDVLSMVEGEQPQWESLADPASRWQLCRDLGALHERIGEWAVAFEYFRRAESIEYLPGLASVLEWQAIVLAQQGRLRDALEKADLAWAAVSHIADPAQRQRSYALLHMHKGRFLFALEEFEDSEIELREALGYFVDRDNDKHNTARCRVLLGRIALDRGVDREAKLRLDDALEGLTGYAMNVEAAEVHDLLAEIADRDGRAVDAAQHHRCAAELRFTQ